MGVVGSLPFLSLSEEGRRRSSVRFFFSSRSDTSVDFFFFLRGNHNWRRRLRTEICHSTHRRPRRFSVAANREDEKTSALKKAAEREKKKKRHHHAAMLRVLYKASETRHGRERRKILVLDFRRRPAESVAPLLPRTSCHLVTVVAGRSCG